MNEVERITIVTTYDDVCDYRIILDNLNIAFIENGLYLEVGTPTVNCGWIIHVSVVRHQIVKLLLNILPFLRSQNEPFKIAASLEDARIILDGAAGPEHVGKIITIYPSGQEEANNIVQHLVRETASHAGPRVLTDKHIGNCVYCRFGAFIKYEKETPGGPKKKYYIDAQKNPVDDIQNIPYNGPEPPFRILNLNNKTPQTHKLPRFKNISTLRKDPKGDVYEILYLSKGWRPKVAILKYGTYHMWEDRKGNDMAERINWQYKLQKQLWKTVNLPEPFETFDDEFGRGIIMQKINGQTITDSIQTIDNFMVGYYNLEKCRKDKIDSMIRGILKIVSSLHSNDIYHRDATPDNFMFDKTGTIYAIDIELAYSARDCYPEIPFERGTIGFMSPQQENGHTPTDKDDIYALGATIISTLFGISPLTYMHSVESVYELIVCFGGDDTAANMISSCFSKDPQKRPDINKLVRTFNTNSNIEYRTESKNKNNRKVDIEETIVKAILGLSQPPNQFHDNLWLIPEFQNTADRTNDSLLVIDRSFHSGIAGIIHVLNQAKKSGFDISHLSSLYNKNLQEAVSDERNYEEQRNPGFNFGTSGIAYSLLGAITADVIENRAENYDLVFRLLDHKGDNTSIGNGLAGAGKTFIELLKIGKLSSNDPRVLEISNQLAQKQNNDGSWKKSNTPWQMGSSQSSFTIGDLGVIHFLADSSILSPQLAATNVPLINKCLPNLFKLTNATIEETKRSGISRHFFNGSVQAESIMGQLITHLKLYEVLQIKQSKDVFLKLMDLLPDKLILDNLSLDCGISGLLKIYANAIPILNNDCWIKNIKWLTEQIILYKKTNINGSLHWTGSNRQYTSPGYYAGNSGIISALLKVRPYFN